MSQKKVDLIDVLVALRKAYIEAVEAINAYLETQAPPAVKADELREKFPEDIRSLLEFNVEGDKCIIRPRHFLGSENFGKIASVVRENGGRYISAGKDSHFEVPIAKP
jgi:hypothetical protein